MSEIGVVIAGAAGRMGRVLMAAVHSEAGLKVVGAVEAPGHPALGQDAGALAGIVGLGVTVTADLPTLLAPGRVLIDFTAPAATMQNLRSGAAAGVAAVVGTTGLSDAQREEVKALARKIPIVLAPNMSVGVNLLFHLVKEAARILGPGFDIEIVEAHHRLKKDAPSGTAIRLAEVAAEGRGWTLKESARYCREGMVGERPEKEIGIQTVRGGDIVGDHTVLFAGVGERVEIIHRAHSRDTLARGAARAVKWVAKIPPGLYDMQDVLGLR